MTEVLDQNEVDALLAAVDTDNVDSASEGPSLRIFSRKRTNIGELEVRPYDFKRPERVSKDQMRALENLHEAFSRNFGASLSGFLRTIIECKVATIEQMTFSEFTHSLPNPTSFNLLIPEPLEGNMCLEISPLIIYPIIDRLLGGSNADLFIPQRPLTAIEMRLVNKILSRAITCLQEAWANVVQLTMRQGESESNPQLVQIVPPNEVVVVIGFELKMGGRAGTMSLCIPYNVIEPVVEKLSSQTWAAYKRGKGAGVNRSRVANQLDSAKVELTAELARTTIKLSELMNLEVGDIVLTEKPASAPLTLMVEGKRKYIGQIGQFKGNRAFKVVRPFTAKDRV
ncbi:MAG: flagellar motor switch protein FliM [Phycisphaeraceae bacterium]